MAFLRRRAAWRVAGGREPQPVDRPAAAQAADGAGRWDRAASNYNLADEAERNLMIDRAARGDCDALRRSNARRWRWRFLTV